MVIDQVGLDFIKEWEGFSASIYNDVAGFPTIGIGHKILPGQDFSAGVTLTEAEGLLMVDLQPVEAAITRLAPGCTQNEFDALCDFAFNEGVGALGELLAHGFSEIPNQLPRWVYAKVKGVETVIPDLVRRRAAEVALFNS